MRFAAFIHHRVWLSTALHVININQLSRPASRMENPHPNLELRCPKLNRPLVCMIPRRECEWS
jgi:hypothetical protein